MVALTKMESEAYAAAIESSEGNGHDFGFTEDMVADLWKRGMGPQVVGGLITSLTQKGLMEVAEPVQVNGEEWVTQFTLPKFQDEYGNAL